MPAAVEQQKQSASKPAVSVAAMSVVLRRRKDSPELTRLPVTDADLMDVFSELWMERYLRRGQSDFPMDRLQFRSSPLVRDGSENECDGFVVEAVGPDGELTRRELATEAVQDIVLRAVQQQIEAGVLKLEDDYTYELVRDRAASPSPNGQPFKTTVHSMPLQYLTVPLAPLVERSREVEPAAGDLMPVFFVEEALAKAERFARKGAAANPPIETGAVLIGPVCSCPRTGELFVVVCDAIELSDAEGTKFSLAYTGKTWGRIQVVLRAMQGQPATRAHRLLGQGHGHNWVPGGGAPLCERCEPGRCARQNCFTSLDDRVWMRSVFSRQPWQLCYIFGLNARRDLLHGLFGLRDNQLHLRGYRVIENFDPVREGDTNPKRERGPR
jgi:hypothetical protein